MIFQMRIPEIKSINFSENPPIQTNNEILSVMKRKSF